MLEIQLQSFCTYDNTYDNCDTIILNALTFMSFVSFGTHIFGDKTLQLPVHLPKLIMNG